MAYSVDWVGKVITIPLSDLTLVGGSNYSLDMADVHVEIRRLESAFDEGLYAEEIINFFPTVTLAGVAKPPTVEFKNGYTVQFGGSNYNVSIAGYDNNILDVLVPGNGISVLVNNSVGKITTGSGLSPTESAQLAAININTIYQNKIIKNYKEVRKISASWYLIIYDDGEVSGGTEIMRKRLTDSTGADITDLAAGVLARELANSV